MDLITKVKLINRFLRLPFVSPVVHKIERDLAYEIAKTAMEERSYNPDSPSGVSAQSDLVVSLTSHSKRIYTVHRTLESIFSQSVKAGKVVLYLGNNEFHSIDQLPEVLRMQCGRGLEIRFVEDVGPATKLIPALKEFPDADIITVDDDIIYPRYLIELLVNAQKRNPGTICGSFVKRLEWKSTNKLLDYNKTNTVLEKQDVTSFMQVAEGFGGIYYPTHCFTDTIFDIDLMSRIAPKTDDLWFWANAVIAGTRITAPGRRRNISLDFHIDPSVQDIALCNYNTFKNGNRKPFEKLCEYFGLVEKLSHHKVKRKK